jgi:Bacterial EndoU nuclease
VSGYGGGHLAGTGRRGASEFPPSWSRDDVTSRILDVARSPDEVPRRLPHGPWHTSGVRDGVRIVVLLDPDGGVRTAFPVEGPGVVHNPDRASDPAHPTVTDLADGRVGYAASVLVGALSGRLDDADAALCRELYAAGEWDELGLLLAAALRASELTAEQREHLAVLR